MIHKGNLIIEKGDTSDYSQLTEVTGNIYIHSNADLKALKSIGGNIYIHSNADLKALKSIGGNIYTHSNADLKALKLESIGGDLSIHSNADLKALKSIGGNIYIHSNADLKAPKLESIGGDLSINSNADLKALKSIGGYLSINSKISIDTAKNLWSKLRKNTKKVWRVSNLVPEWLIERVSSRDNSQFYIENVELPLEWFNKIRKDELTPQEVFAIDNIEHRRLAYKYMDKAKMKQLKNFAVSDEKIDEKGNPMKIVSFNVQNMKEDLIFYNCFCPSTKREYFLQTKYKTCDEAKARCFGLEKVEWLNEW